MHRGSNVKANAVEMLISGMRPHKNIAFETTSLEVQGKCGYLMAMMLRNISEEPISLILVPFIDKDGTL